MHVIIVGGGIIGCSVAYHLLSKARGGLQVTLVERNQGVGLEASQAAAGILWPRETNPGAWLDAAAASFTRWQPLAERLRDEEGVDVGYRHTGLFQLSFDTEDEAEGAYVHGGTSAPAHPGVSWLDRRELLEEEPGLHSHVRGGFFYPDAGHVNPLTAVRSLMRAAVGKGLHLRLGAHVTEFLIQGDRVTGVRLADETLSADCTVVAGGAWSRVLGRNLGVDVPLRPVKGQALSVRPVRSPFRHILTDGSVYLVARPSGSVVVGSTQEEAEFDKTVRARVVRDLIGRAEGICPQLGEASFERSWTGLRPATPDGMPILGEVAGVKGLWLATGHFSTGILWAPITGEVIRDLVLGDEPPIDVTPFHLARFSQ